MTRTKNQKHIPIHVSKLPTSVQNQNSIHVSKLPTSIQNQNQNHSLSDSIKQGFSFGVGSSIANNMINRIFTFNPCEENKNENHCGENKNKNETEIYELYNKCLEKNDKNIDCIDILSPKTRKNTNIYD